MLITILKQDAWQLKVNPGQQEFAAQIDDLNALITQLNQLPITFKSNHRSTVLHGHLYDRSVVAKRPNDKNRRQWARLLSWFEASEAARTLQSLALFADLGIQSTKPLFILEQRRLGQVTDSWIVYEHRAGQTCDHNCAKDIAQFLQTMHQYGFQHGDPTLNNFLRDDDGVLFTIDCKGRQRRGVFSDTVDYFLFQTDSGVNDTELTKWVDPTRRGMGYRLANLYIGFKKWRAKLRDAIRKNRPQNRQN